MNAVYIILHKWDKADDDWFCCAAVIGNDLRLHEVLRPDPMRKGSVVNVNPVNTRPQSDTPEIRKYKKRFNSEILCAALWGT